MLVNPKTQQLVPLSFTNASFQADATTLSTLVSLANNGSLLFSNSGGVGPLQLLQPNLDLYDPDRYQLTDADGTVYVIQQPTGLESITDRNGNTTAFTYGAQNYLLTRTNPLGHADTFTYDAFQQMLTHTDPRGKVETSTYDAQCQSNISILFGYPNYSPYRKIFFKCFL